MDGIVAFHEGKVVLGRPVEVRCYVKKAYGFLFESSYDLSDGNHENKTVNDPGNTVNGTIVDVKDGIAVSVCEGTC